jgi:hypothetical protein
MAKNFRDWLSSWPYRQLTPADFDPTQEKNVNTPATSRDTKLFQRTLTVVLLASLVVTSGTYIAFAKLDRSNARVNSASNQESSAKKIFGPLRNEAQGHCSDAASIRDAVSAMALSTVSERKQLNSKAMPGVEAISTYEIGQLVSVHVATDCAGKDLWIVLLAKQGNSYRVLKINPTSHDDKRG